MPVVGQTLLYPGYFKYLHVETAWPFEPKELN